MRRGESRSPARCCAARRHLPLSRHQVSGIVARIRSDIFWCEDHIEVLPTVITRVNRRAEAGKIHVVVARHLHPTIPIVTGLTVAAAVAPCTIMTPPTATRPEAC